jgi:hypothetical protein
MAFSNQRQRLREDVQRMMRKKSAEHQVKADDIPDGGMATTKLAQKKFYWRKLPANLRHR